MDGQAVELYLNRLGMEGPVEATFETFRQIQERHLYTVPFENLDVIEGNVPLSLDVDDLFDKVVMRRRGGMCYELNLLLAELLEALGFEVRRMSARHPKYGDDFDHAFLMVNVPGEVGDWVVDVGFADNFRTPLRFDPRIWQGDERDDYTFRPSEAEGVGEGYWDLMRRRGGIDSVMYTFSLAVRSAGEYAPRCEWYCTSPDSRFTKGPLVCIERPEGRMSLTMDRVLNTRNGERIREEVETREQFAAVLREIFGIELDDAFDGFENDVAGFRRIFVALDGGELQDAVIAKAVGVARGTHAHVRFGHIVDDYSRKVPGGDFPAYVRKVRADMEARLNARLEEIGVAGQLYGGELVVVGSNSQIGATVDTPANSVPERIVDMLIKPYEPDLVICGSRSLSRFEYLLKRSTSDYLVRKLDCDVLLVRG